MSNVIDRTIAPGYWVNYKRTSPIGGSCISGIMVTSHVDGVIKGTSSFDDSVVCIFDTDPAIISHTMPDFDAFDRISAQFRAGEISRSEFEDAFQRFV